MYINELTPFWWGVYRFVMLATLVTLPLAGIGLRYIIAEARKEFADER